LFAHVDISIDIGDSKLQTQPTSKALIGPSRCNISGSFIHCTTPTLRPLGHYQNPIQIINETPVTVGNIGKYHIILLEIICSFKIFFRLFGTDRVGTAVTL
jgi:hypothetical protein